MDNVQHPKSMGKTIKVERGTVPRSTLSKESNPQAQQVKLQDYADKLKENATKSELIVLAELRLRGWKFEFQFILHGYIPDFYFPDQNKIVELDGKKFHNKVKDAKRDKILKSKGIKTLRINSYRVFTSFDWVMEEIESFIMGKPISKRKIRQTKSTKSKKNQQSALKDSDSSLERFLFLTEGL